MNSLDWLWPLLWWLKAMSAWTGRRCPVCRRWSRCWMPTGCQEGTVCPLVLGGPAHLLSPQPSFSLFRPHVWPHLLLLLFFLPQACSLPILKFHNLFWMLWPLAGVWLVSGSLLVKRNPIYSFLPHRPWPLGAHERVSVGEGGAGQLGEQGQEPLLPLWP